VGRPHGAHGPDAALPARAVGPRGVPKRHEGAGMTTAGVTETPLEGAAVVPPVVPRAVRDRYPPRQAAIRRMLAGGDVAAVALTCTVVLVAADEPVARGWPWALVGSAGWLAAAAAHGL